MKIAVVHFIAVPTLGAGAAVKSVMLARALRGAGVSTTFIASDIGLAAGALPEMPGVEVVVIPSRFRRFPVPKIDTPGMRRLVGGYSAVILMSHWSVLNALAYRSARACGVPCILCPAGALRVQGRSRWLKRLYQVIVGRKMIAGAAAVIATTELEATQLRQDGVPGSRIQVIPNGVDPAPVGMSAEEFRAAHAVPPVPILLFMGRFNVIKGPDLLLDAFGRVAGRFPEWRLVMAGRDEGLEPALRRRTEQLGLSSRVHFVGHLNPFQSTGAYRAASLLVVPSRHEAMSLVALEAGMAGTPVLLTDACGFAEIAAAGGGRVVPATAAGIAEGLSALLGQVDQLCAMGTRLRNLVLTKYGWPTVVQQYIELVRRVGRTPATGAPSMSEARR